MVTPSAKRRAVEHLRRSHHLSISKTCSLVSHATSTYYYHARRPHDTALRRELVALRDAHPRRGVDVFYKRLRAAGHPWNRKRVHRVYTELRMHIRKPLKRLFPTRTPAPLAVPAAPIVSWSMDFMADALDSGRKVRVLNVIDDFNRESR